LLDKFSSDIVQVQEHLWNAPWSLNLSLDNILTLCNVKHAMSSNYDTNILNYFLFIILRDLIVVLDEELNITYNYNFLF